jgi:3-oxoacyl-[acyl-carrier protein] reductase
MTRLSGRVALVTGGASGIGLATARRLAAEGASVAIADLDESAAAREAAELGGERALGIGCDVTDADACVRAVAAVTQRFGSLDILHANAGSPFAGPIGSVDGPTLDRVLGVNLRGAFLSAQAVVPVMKQRRAGAIIFTSSLQGVIARPNFTPYTAAKHGVIGLMKGLALELAPHGIRVNAIAPGPTETPMLGKFLGGMAEVDDEAREAFRRSIPLGRLVEPEDIAAAVAYLASDDARMVTGHVLVIDGGATAG